jgi:hypothetical protein
MWAWTSEHKILKILTEHVKTYIWSSKTWNHALWSSKKWNHAFERTVPKLTLINWALHAFICIGKGSNYKHQSHQIFHNGNKTTYLVTNRANQKLLGCYTLSCLCNCHCFHWMSKKVRLGFHHNLWSGIRSHWRRQIVLPKYELYNIFIVLCEYLVQLIQAPILK